MSLPPAFPGRRVRRLVIWCVAVLAMMCFAYGTLWLLAENRFRAATLTWIEHRKAEGYQISFTGLEIGGFPAVVRITLAAPMVTGRQAGGSWFWSGEKADVEIGPLDPEHVTVKLAGDQTLHLEAGGRLFSYEGSASELTIVAAHGGGLSASAMTVRDLVLRPVEGGDAVAAARIDVTTQGDPEARVEGQTATFALTLKAADIELPSALGLPLGGDVAGVALAAKLIGTLEAGPWPETLARWRDAGGTVEVSRLELLYGPMTLTADGTLALDAANQPIAAFSAHIVGAAPTVDALRQRGLIEDGNAVAAKMALGLMARRPVGGGEPIVDVPLTLQNRTLHAGPLALAVIPEIRWPKTAPQKP